MFTITDDLASSSWIPEDVMLKNNSNRKRRFELLNINPTEANECSEPVARQRRTNERNMSEINNNPVNNNQPVMHGPEVSNETRYSQNEAGIDAMTVNYSPGFTVPAHHNILNNYLSHFNEIHFLHWYNYQRSIHNQTLLNQLSQTYQWAHLFNLHNRSINNNHHNRTSSSNTVFAPVFQPTTLSSTTQNNSNSNNRSQNNTTPPLNSMFYNNPQNVENSMNNVLYRINYGLGESNEPSFSQAQYDNPRMTLGQRPNNYTSSNERNNSTANNSQQQPQQQPIDFTFSRPNQPSNAQPQYYSTAMNNPTRLINCPYHNYWSLNPLPQFIPNNTNNSINNSSTNNQNMPYPMYYNPHLMAPPIPQFPVPLNPHLDALLSWTNHMDLRSRGISRDELDKIQTYRFKATSMATGVKSNEKETEDENPRCMVCLDDFEAKQNIRILHCKHEFHSKCIDKWLKINRTCPTCRADAYDGTRQTARTS